MQYVDPLGLSIKCKFYVNHGTVEIGYWVEGYFCTYEHGAPATIALPVEGWGGGSVSDQSQRNYEKDNHDCVQQASTASAEDFKAAKTMPKARSVIGGGVVGYVGFVLLKGNPWGWALGVVTAFKDNIGGALVGTAKSVATYNLCMASKGYVMPHGH